MALNRGEDRSKLEAACKILNDLAIDVMGQRPFYVNGIYPDSCPGDHGGYYNRHEGYCYEACGQQEAKCWSVFHDDRTGAISPKDQEYLEGIQRVIELAEAQKEVVMISFLGRNTEKILADARREFPRKAENILLITREQEALQPPEGIAAVSVDTFVPDATKEYLVVANGGSTDQLLPTIKKLVEVGVEFSAWNVQRDGVTQVW